MPCIELELRTYANEYKFFLKNKVEDRVHLNKESIHFLHTQ